MINHHFQPRHRVVVCIALLLLLIVPTLVVIGVSWHQQQQLSSALAEDSQQLLKHRQAAEAIRAKQRSFAKAPQQQELTELKGLALLAQALRSDIALLSLEMEPGEQRMRIAVLSSSLDGLLDFVTRLQHLPAKVSLESHQTEHLMPEPWKIRAHITLEYSDAP